MLFAVLVDQHSALAAQRDQHVARAHALKLLGVALGVLLGLDLDAEDLGELLAVRLDEEGLVFQRVDEQLLGRVDDDADILVLYPLEHALVDVVGKGVGDAARDDQGVAVLDAVDLLQQAFKLGFLDMGTLAVDLGLIAGFDLDVDPRDTVFELDEVRDDVVVADAVFDRLAGEARHKAEGGAVESQLGEHAGHVDALAAVVVFLVGGAVGNSCHKLVEPHDVVDRGVEGYCVDQVITSLMTVSVAYDLSGRASVIMQQVLSCEKVTGNTRLNLVLSAITNAM